MLRDEVATLCTLSAESATTMPAERASAPSTATRPDMLEDLLRLLGSLLCAYPDLWLDERMRCA